MIKILIPLLLLAASSLQAEEFISAVSFSDEPLTVSAVAGQQRYLLIELPDPGISTPVYALKGRVRYENVQGDGYLQMDNHFGAQGTFFTKSLAVAGPLARITGSSDWRAFVLPFYANSGDRSAGAAPLPEKLSLSLYLPGSGTVSIGQVALYQYAGGEDPLQTGGLWFNTRAAGLLGGIGGAFVGVWGALIGALSSRGRARGFVLASANAMLILGLASLVGGLVALAGDQPYSVYYPFLLIGIILVVVIGTMRGKLAAQYEQLELKKMRSMDV